MKILLKDIGKTRRDARVKWLDARRSENFAAFHLAATRRPNKTTPTSKMAQRGQQITAHQDTQQERSTDDTRCGLYAVANSNPKYFSRRQNNDAKTTLSGPTKQRDDSSDKPPPFSLGRPRRQKKNRCGRLKVHKRISSAVTCVCRVLQKIISRQRNYNKQKMFEHPFLKRIHDRQRKLSPHEKK